jgi:hypothetical protein
MTHFDFSKNFNGADWKFSREIMSETVSFDWGPNSVCVMGPYRGWVWTPSEATIERCRAAARATYEKLLAADSVELDAYYWALDAAAEFLFDIFESEPSLGVFQS